MFSKDEFKLWQEQSLLLQEDVISNLCSLELFDLALKKKKGAKM